MCIKPVILPPFYLCLLQTCQRFYLSHDLSSNIYTHTHTEGKKVQHGHTTYLSLGRFRQVAIPKLPGNLQDEGTNSIFLFSIAFHLSLTFFSPLLLYQLTQICVFMSLQFASLCFLWLYITKTHLKRNLSPAPTRDCITWTHPFYTHTQTHTHRLTLTLQTGKNVFVLIVQHFSSIHTQMKTSSVDAYKATHTNTHT